VKHPEYITALERDTKKLSFTEYSNHEFEKSSGDYLGDVLTLNLPTTTIVAQPFNIIKWQLKFNPVA